jgi:hypothetical protein
MKRSVQHFSLFAPHGRSKLGLNYRAISDLAADEIAERFETAMRSGWVTFDVVVRRTPGPILRGLSFRHMGRHLLQ